MALFLFLFLFCFFFLSFFFSAFFGRGGFQIHSKSLKHTRRECRTQNALQNLMLYSCFEGMRPAQRRICLR